MSYFRHHFQRNALAALQENIAENAENKERLLTITKSKITVHENSNLSADELTISTADLALQNTHQVIVACKHKRCGFKLRVRMATVAENTSNHSPYLLNSVQLKSLLRTYKLKYDCFVQSH